MGGREDGGKGTLDKHKKIDDSEGMCGSESDYDSCWGRICRTERGNVLRDVLRGLLVLIALAIVITVVFLLCFFLLNDIEQKEEELVDTLIKDFSTGNRIDTELEFSIRDENKVKSEYPYDIDTRSEFKKNKESLSERTRPPKPISKEEENVHQIDGPKSNFNTEDDVFLSFTNPDASQHSPTDSEIANTEGSFVGAFVPKSDEVDMTFDVITEFTQTQSDGQCVPLRLPLCSGSMPWTITKFPNFVNNTNEKELHESATYFQSVIVGSRCSTRATEYTCAILEPACGPDGIPLPPCRTFCEDILKSCSDFLITGNRHNTAFVCQHYPESTDPNVCVDISRTSSSSSNSELHDNVGELPVIPKTEETLPPVLNENPEESEVIPETDVKTEDSPFVNIEESPLGEIAPTDAPVFICDHSKFLCDDGSDCLSDESVCDGVQDCLDNSDELNCTQPEVTPVSIDFPFTSDSSNQEITVMTSTLFPTFKLKEWPKPRPQPRNKDKETMSSIKRTSLSDMLLSSSLVAVPSPTVVEVEVEPTEETLRNKRPKAINSIEKPYRNAFGSPRVSPLPSKPTERKSKTQKLSLASLLSSSTGTRAQFEEPLPDYEEQIALPSQRSLSALLSSVIPSFSPARRRKSFGSSCFGFRCRGDGSCLAHERVNDGVLDCVDGTDERTLTL